MYHRIVASLLALTLLMLGGVVGEQADASPLKPDGRIATVDGKPLTMRVERTASLPPDWDGGTRCADASVGLFLGGVRLGRWHPEWCWTYNETGRRGIRNAHFNRQWFSITAAGSLTGLDWDDAAHAVSTWKFFLDWPFPLDLFDGWFAGGEAFEGVKIGIHAVPLTFECSVHVGMSWFGTFGVDALNSNCGEL